MNLPNVFTISRIVLAGVMVLLLVERSWTSNILAVAVFTLASLTDFYDGHLAKTRGLISDFGKIMDPVADKVLLLCVFGALAHLGLVAWWMFAIIAAREIMVTASRLLAMRQGQVLAAERSGKVKTVVQMTAVSAILLYLVAEPSWWFERVQAAWADLNTILMLAAVALTIYSGFDYFRHKNAKFSA